jgi:hypothetical protein
MLTQRCGTVSDDILVNIKETTTPSRSTPHIDQKPVTAALLQSQQVTSAAQSTASHQDRPEKARRRAAVTPTTVGTLCSLFVLFVQLFWSSLRVVGGGVASTLRLLLYSITSDCIIFTEVFRLWHSFAYHSYATLVFSAAIILLKALSILSWLVGFCPRKGCSIPQESELVGTPASKPPGLEDMAPRAKSSSVEDQ